MNGVVLWSSPESWQAIVWCEDHAELAHARGAECFVAGAGFPAKGDLIACEVTEGEGMRRARAVRVVMRGAFPELANDLRAAAGGAPAMMPAEPEPPRVPHLVAVAGTPERRQRPAATATPRPRPALRLAVAS